VLLAPGLKAEMLDLLTAKINPAQGIGNYLAIHLDLSGNDPFTGLGTRAKAQFRERAVQLYALTW
jgi:hypothetical protein